MAKIGPYSFDPSIITFWTLIFRALTGDAHKIFAHAIEEGPGQLTTANAYNALHTSSGGVSLAIFATLLQITVPRNIRDRPIVNCKTTLRTAISHSRYDKT